MDSNQLYLFKTRKFWPIFITQFCGCLNDNILKNAIIILITYKLASDLGTQVNMLVLFANATLVVPFVVFASLSGQIADKFERTTIVKIIKFCEILIIIAALYGFLYSSLIILFCCVGAMGIHSAFFGPIKYSVLPDLLQKDELLAANGYIEAATFIAILIGTIIGGFYNSGSTAILFIMILISIAGFISSFYMPLSNNANPEIKINYNIYAEGLNIIKYAHSKKQVYLSILGISWFWFIGAAIIAEIPSLTKNIFGADENVANLFLAIFSMGVGMGSYWCNKIFENEITTKYVFISAIAISIFGIDLFFASQISAINHQPEQLRSIFVFLSKKHNWRIIVDLFCLAAAGGLYIVPLYAVIQYFSAPSYRSRIISANNLINSLFMSASSVMLSILFYFNFSVPSIILLVCLLNLVVAFYIYELIPEIKIVPFKIWRALFKFVFDKMYNVQVRGLENFELAGKRTVIIANHVSYLDPALLATYLPGNIIFAINTSIAQLYWVKPFLKIARTIMIDPTNSIAIKSLINEVKKGRKIAIFPEGRISITGALMKIYEGPGIIADKTDASILPIRIEGAQFTHFTKLKNLSKIRLFPKIVITILPPVKFEKTEDIGKDRRKYLGQKLYDIMSDMMFESSEYQKTIFQSLIDATKIYGNNHLIAQDIDNNDTSYRKLLLKSFILGKLISRQTQPEEYVGIMLPNSVGSLIAFYALQSRNRIPAMINFTSGAASIISGCKTSGVKIIYTSKRFIVKAELEGLIEKLEHFVSIVYLEDIRQELTFGVKLQGLIAMYFPQSYYNQTCQNHDHNNAAVILFTSGTEGQPKAVALSHSNIQANRNQITARLDFGVHDLAFNALPMFHCFGLTASLLMSLTGIKTFFYPSPLHYRIIPEIIYDISATIMFGTDSFLNGYTKYAHPYDFYSLRYVFAGAEKLRAKTRQFWFDKYGVRIFEGYGATETAPVISANTPMHDKPGTIGRLMPKINYQITPVEGINRGGLLHVQGPNIMLGYILSDNPTVINPTQSEVGDGWYNTGDIVEIDDEGYLTILGRSKRFAKVAGEMVSLTLIEEIASSVDDNLHAAIYFESETRGEQIYLVSTSNSITKEKFAQKVRELGLSNLNIPKIFIHLHEIPLFATGKTNYIKLTELVKSN